MIARIRHALVASAAMMLAAASANAITLGFVNITGNDLANAAAGEAQLTVTISNMGGGQILVEFMNAGPDAMSITDVYFDDGTLLGIASIINGSGVAFSQGAAPGNLPGGNAANPDFVATVGFTADSDPPVVANGVNPGEKLGVVFNLLPGMNFGSVMSALDTGELRIGIHVQGFANGGSESFVNDGGPPPVPAPAAGALGLAGLGALGARRRR